MGGSDALCQRLDPGHPLLQLGLAGWASQLRGDLLLTRCLPTPARHGTHQRPPRHHRHHTRTHLRAPGSPARLLVRVRVSLPLPCRGMLRLVSLGLLSERWLVEQVPEPGCLRVCAWHGSGLAGLRVSSGNLPRRSWLLLLLAWVLTWPVQGRSRLPLGYAWHSRLHPRLRCWGMVLRCLLPLHLLRLHPWVDRLPGVPGQRLPVLRGAQLVAPLHEALVLSTQPGHLRPGRLQLGAGWPAAAGPAACCLRWHLLGAVQGVCTWRHPLQTQVR